MSQEGRPSYGGQAVIEGVMMRGPNYVALSVRDPYGNIKSFTKEVKSLSQRNSFTRLPIVRGMLSLWESLSLGIGMLLESAEIASPEEEKPSDSSLTMSVLFAAVLAVGLFIVLPSFATEWIMRAVSLSGGTWVSFIESAMRLSILVIYILAISQMEDIQRILQYHGAEHKVIWAFEKNSFNPEEFGTSKEAVDGVGESAIHGSDGFQRAVGSLVEKAQWESRLHPRCGTSFLFIVVLVTWLVFLFVSPSSLPLRILSRIALLPLVAGLAYEILRLSAIHEGIMWDILKAPGVYMQKLTTKEPSKDQLEVAATSLLLLVKEEFQVV